MRPGRRLAALTWALEEELRVLVGTCVLPKATQRKVAGGRSGNPVAVSRGMVASSWQAAVLFARQTVAGSIAHSGAQHLPRSSSVDSPAWQ